MYALVIATIAFAVSSSDVSGGKIKIIDEPFSAHGSNTGNEHQLQPSKLVPKVDPSPVSGPVHFTRLKGKCFRLTKQSFKYEFCPFHNLTQREQSYRWNAFHGVLGVWKEWTIENNTFVAMKMGYGDHCVANILREAKVFLICGDVDELTDVKEPITCKYEVRFKTPAACPKDAFLVYPSLSSSGREAWDDIQTGLYADEITLQGYEKKLRRIFYAEGLQLDPEEDKAISQMATGARDIRVTHDQSQRFASLTQCIQEYDKLEQEVKRLRSFANATEYLEKNPGSRESVAVKVISELIKQTQRQTPKDPS